jgi:alkylation response protein AidB-like acyl-CoA dehydrogenase
MDFRLSEDQRQLQAGTRELLAGRFGRERLRAAVDAGGALDRALWAELRAAGLFALRAPGASGLGLGLAEAVLVFEEAGRALLPGPLVATELAAALGLGDDTGPVAALVRLPPGRGPLLVEQLPSLDLLLVLDTAAGWLRLLDPAEALAASRPVRGVDPLTPLWELTGPLPPGRTVDGADAARLWAEGTLLTAASQVGLAARALESAVGYARQREQFGRPIGSFQAVQHLCADLLGRLEPARVAVRAAAVLLDDGPRLEPAARAEVAGAKLLADEAAVRGARDCLQIHGGMGFTWEGDVQLLLKRAWVWQQGFAGERECAEELAVRVLADWSS